MSTRIEFTYTANPLPYTTNGITWDSPVSHRFSANGTATANSVIYLYRGSTKPSWLQYDIDYDFTMVKSGTTNNVVFYFEGRENGTWYNFIYTYQSSGTFNVPTRNYDYFNIALRVSNGYSVDETVYPYVYESKVFVPRTSVTSPTDMRGSVYYSGQTAGYYAMPNCTRYAYGRWWEIMGTRPAGLWNLHNGEDWWGNVSAYNKGQEPRLGAIICFADGPWSGLGHVAVVEKIYANGDILCSNSAYGGDYFYMTQVNRRDNYQRDTGGYYHNYVGYRFQGFIYLPDEYSPNPPSPNPPNLNKPFWFYLRRKPF